MRLKSFSQNVNYRFIKLKKYSLYKKKSKPFLRRQTEIQTPWMPAPITPTEDLDLASSFIV